jgi:hypothetical protein
MLGVRAMASGRLKEVFSEHIVEVRYKPNPELLDRRGERATALLEALEFEHWEVADRVVRVTRADKKESAFVAYHNAGMTCQDLRDGKEFGEKAKFFCRLLGDLPGIAKVVPVNRLGVRSKFLQLFDGSFEALRELVMAQWVDLRPAYLKALGGSVEDVGAPFIMKDTVGNYNTSGGPMKQEQAMRFLPREHDLPAVSLYFDIDYWWTPKAEVDFKEIAEKAGQFAEAGWDKYVRVTGLLEGN